MRQRRITQSTLVLLCSLERLSSRVSTVTRASRLHVIGSLVVHIGRLPEVDDGHSRTFQLEKYRPEDTMLY